MRGGGIIDWFSEAIKQRDEGWELQRIADYHDKSLQTVKNRFTRYNKKVRRKQESQKNLPEEVRRFLNKERTKEEVCEHFGISQRVLDATLADLTDEGFLISEYGDFVKLQRTVVPNENVHEQDWGGEQIIRFGAVSDTHLCSKWQQLTYLNSIYDLFAQEGIDIVYNGGDLTEGVNMRRGHELEVFVHGADAQAQYVIDNYPKRDGIITKFITGNHDHSSIKHAGHDIGYKIADKRSDMVYLGTSQAKVKLTPNCTLEINHPLDGAAYALSYALQKMIDAMSGGEKPNIYLGGHHHKAMYLFYRNIHAFELGTLQAQTSWMRGKRLPAHMGGWIVEIHVDDSGTITRCKGEFIPCYVAIENDY